MRPHGAAEEHGNLPWGSLWTLTGRAGLVGATGSLILTTSVAFIGIKLVPHPNTFSDSFTHYTRKGVR